jgi:hypothetical protein
MIQTKSLITGATGYTGAIRFGSYSKRIKLYACSPIGSTSDQSAAEGWR